MDIPNVYGKTLTVIDHNKPEDHPRRKLTGTVLSASCDQITWYEFPINSCKQKTFHRTRDGKWFKGQKELIVTT